MNAEVIQVIRTTLERRGDGKVQGDPVRLIEQFWSFDGERLAENDPWIDDASRCRVLLTKAVRLLERVNREGLTDQDSKVWTEASDFTAQMHEEGWV